MKTNKKAVLRQVIILAAAILFLQLLLGCVPAAAALYHRFLFLPLQYLRGALFHLLPADIGDWLYLAAGLLLLRHLLRLLIRLLRHRPSWPAVAASLLRGSRLLLGAYLLLLLLWGGNYFRAPLSEQLALPPVASLQSADLLLFDSLLVARLNELAPQYAPVDRETVNREGAAGFRSLSRWYRVRAKASVFGNGMAYFGIEGYFNPFTGEAQVNAQIPAFMRPFVLMHEMAHQTGIAAEDDANLMAYIRCVSSALPGIRYSAYFNLWLYTHRQARMIDTATAGRYKRQLNSLSLAQVDTLRAIRRKYSSPAEQYSSNLYDAYLKLGQQQMGIESYRNVAFTALCWERSQGLLPRKEKGVTPQTGMTPEH